MRIKFQFYINIGPITEEVLKYLSFILGTFCLAYAMYKFIKSRYNTTTNSYNNSVWIEDEFTAQTDIEKKLCKYIPEKRASMNARELEVYINSLVTPLNQEISFQEFVEMKEEIV